MFKISIIIPCYNVEQFIKKCLNSIINQTYNNLEIICVNDGSDDSTLKILENYALLDNRIVIIDKKNEGLSSARNAGIKKASGDYIIFVDSDDFLELDTCEVALKKSCEYNVDLVIWNYVKEYENKSIEKLIFQNEEVFFDSNDCQNILCRRIFGLCGEELKKPENTDSLVTAWGKLYKSSLIKDNNVNFVDTQLIGTEDALFNATVFMYVKSAIYIPNCLNHYRKDNVVSLTSTYKPDLFDKWNVLYDYMAKIIDDNNLPNEFHYALNNRIALSIIGLGLNELSNPNGAISQVRNISKFIKSTKYKKAYSNLTLSYFPIHWKVFFFLAKRSLIIGVYLLLVVMKKLVGK